MSFFCINEERHEILSGDVTAALLLADWRVMLATIQFRAFGLHVKKSKNENIEGCDFVWVRNLV
jgi:hypothetical protein